jgi:hypothetical protein
VGAGATGRSLRPITATGSGFFPPDDAEAAALLRSMLAYTGRFRMEGDREVVSVDGAWNEV